MTELKRPILIAVTDRQRLRLPFADWAVAVVAGGVDLVQLREKDLADSELSGLAHDISEAIGPTRLQINGNPALARALGCGLHLPESAPSIAAPPRPFSRAVHDFSRINTAESPEFLVAGHIFATASKPDLPARGCRWLASGIVSSPVPVVAIGGITPNNAAEIMHTGAAGIAVISALATSDHPEEAAKQLRSIIDREWRPV